MNGKGSPLTGISPTVIAVFTKTWANSIDPKPIKIKLENRPENSNSNRKST